MEVEWQARWSGGMKQAAVLIGSEGVVPQRDFARHIRHVKGGRELYRAEVEEEDTVLFLYLSGSGKTATAEELTGARRSWASWDEAEAALSLPEGSLEGAFFGRRLPARW